MAGSPILSSMKRQERHDGPTPAGGAYSVGFYDGDRLVEIVEFDAEDRPIARIYNEPQSPERERQGSDIGTA